MHAQVVDGQHAEGAIQHRVHFRYQLFRAAVLAGGIDGEAIGNGYALYHLLVYTITGQTDVHRRGIRIVAVDLQGTCICTRLARRVAHRDVLGATGCHVEAGGTGDGEVVAAVTRQSDAAGGRTAVAHSGAERAGTSHRYVAESEGGRADCDVARLNWRLVVDSRCCCIAISRTVIVCYCQGYIICTRCCIGVARVGIVAGAAITKVPGKVRYRAIGIIGTGAAEAHRNIRSASVGPVGIRRRRYIGWRHCTTVVATVPWSASHFFIIVVATVFCGYITRYRIDTSDTEYPVAITISPGGAYHGTIIIFFAIPDGHDIVITRILTAYCQLVTVVAPACAVYIYIAGPCINRCKQRGCK